MSKQDMIKTNFFGKEVFLDRELKNRKELSENLQSKGFVYKNILLLNQIHGKEIVVIDDTSKIYGEQNLPKADGIITNLKNIAIGVITADCAPILLFDEEKEIIGAVHAGWRGAKSGIVLEAINTMKNLGAKRISAKIGPMIQQDSYEVSADFVVEFIKENPGNKKFFVDCKKTEKSKFDLSSYIEAKLYESGVFKVDNQKVDTFSDSERFFSFRRSTQRKESDCGRNVSIICIN